MHGFRRPRPEEGADAAVAALAARQHGVVAHRQLVALGVSPAAIEWRLRSRRLHRIHRGVYLVGHTAITPRAREIAAVLACRPRALISHRSAAQLWALLPYPAQPDRIDVTVLGRKPKPRPGIRIHPVREIRRDDITRLDGIPLTRPARTALDIASQVTIAELERAVAEARTRGLVGDAALFRQLERNPGRRGAAVLRGLLEREHGPALTRSEAERRLLRLIRAASLPQPVTNARVAGFEVDFLWRVERVVVEVDGYAYHSDRHAFERDRRRDAELAALGYTVIRVTWRQLTEEPYAVVERLARALRAASSAAP